MQTQEDIQLQECLSRRVEQMRQGILHGRPYVWELRLSFDEFNVLEAAINQSISSHAGKHDHLLSEEFAVIVVMYLAEWYKRFYKGNDTQDENKILALTSKELERLYDLSGIDKNTYVYNASKNPDKTSYRWLESMQVLGGLAVQAELKRDDNDRLLSRLCKIFHGEDIELDDLKDRNRAVAFQESIARQHSLYEYLKCILEKDERGRRNLPFASSDIKDENTYIPQLIRKIEEADRLAKKNKFDFEWMITYSAGRSQMVRHLKVKLKPEVIGGGKKQYIGYDRLRQPEWGIEHPENIGRIRFYVRFKNGNHYVQKEGKQEEPLFKYDNTGSEMTGFLSVNKEDENTYMNVPVGRFNKVEIVMKYDDECQVVQSLEVKDYMQVYSLPKKPTMFSDRRNSQRPTFLIFSSAYHLTKEYSDLSVVYAHFRNGDHLSEDYCWCPINDKVIIADNEGHEVTPPFFNRNGLFQVVTKKYLKTIKYNENLYVLYQYIDTDDDEDVYQNEPQMPVLFGRSGLQVLHYKSGQTKESEPLTDYDLEWQRPDGRYVDWDKEEPEQGVIRLRVTVKGIVFRPKVYYVPFAPADSEQQPIWRDFEHQRICTSLEGVDEIQDDIKQLLEGKETAATKQLMIGTKDARILVDVYRPVIVKELTQKHNDEVNISYHEKGEDIHIPLIDCEQFSVRDFSENGVKEYQVQNRSTVYYNFPTFNQTSLRAETYTEEYSAKELTTNIPLDYLKIYMTKPLDNMSDLYAWDYMSEPTPVESPNELTGEGIVFQSLKDDDSPRDYAMPVIKKKSGWGGKKNVVVVDPLFCYETVAEHKTYFFLFSPLIKVISGMTQIKDIFLPLMRKRNYQFTDADIDNLYRFAMQFHFDWMLLPRELWENEIETFAATDDERKTIKEKVIEFFQRTPKITDEREELHLKDFLRRYWAFDVWPKVEDIAEKALKLIKNDGEALGNLEMRDFLKQYDECRYKFIEMCKVVDITD